MTMFAVDCQRPLWLCFLMYVLIPIIVLYRLRKVQWNPTLPHQWEVANGILEENLCDQLWNLRQWLPKERDNTSTESFWRVCPSYSFNKKVQTNLKEFSAFYNLPEIEGVTTWIICDENTDKGLEQWNTSHHFQQGCHSVKPKTSFWLLNSPSLEWQSQCKTLPARGFSLQKCVAESFDEVPGNCNCTTFMHMYLFVVCSFSFGLNWNFSSIQINWRCQCNLLQQQVYTLRRICTMSDSKRHTSGAFISRK